MIKNLFKPKTYKRNQITDNRSLINNFGFKNPVYQVLKIPEYVRNLKKFPTYRKQIDEVMQMKIKVEESIKLEDGKHNGEIEDVEYKSPKGFDYMDLVIKTKVKDKDVKIKVGYPRNITENSALGQLLERFGAKLEIDKDLEPEEFLTKGKEVVFQTITKDKYYDVILESVKPK